MSNCTALSVTIGVTTYTHLTLPTVTLTSGTEMTVNDITIAGGKTSANCIIIF